MKHNGDLLGSRCDPAMLGTSGYDRKPADRYYTIESWITEALLARIQLRGAVWECAAGAGHMLGVLEAAGHRMVASDIAGTGLGCAAAIAQDFLAARSLPAGVESIVTNPPYHKQAPKKFIDHALRLTREREGIVAMLCRHEYDAAAGRRYLFDRPPFRQKLVLTKRPLWIEGRQKAGPRFPFSWYVWDWRWAGPAQLSYFHPAPPTLQLDLFPR